MGKPGLIQVGLGQRKMLRKMFHVVIEMLAKYTTGGGEEVVSW